ncbi:hypothetical protein D3C81_1977000 [compost metagenome]
MATAIAASNPLREVPIMPTRQARIVASINPDQGLGKKERVDSSSSGQTWPVAITARSYVAGSDRFSAQTLTP